MNELHRQEYISGDEALSAFPECLVFELVELRRQHEASWPVDALGGFGSQPPEDDVDCCSITACDADARQTLVPVFRCEFDTECIV